jgi:diguanylate cyclase (GGDEF)-like protein
MHRRYGVVFSLVIFDVDTLKQINHDYGHLHGDRVLQQLATLIDQNARETDVVARFGGEEFVIVLPGSELAGASVFAERIRQTVERLAPLTITGGVVIVEEGDDAKTLLARADSAMYAAKAAGRNRIYCHTGQSVLPCHEAGIEATDRAELQADPSSEQHDPKEPSESGIPTERLEPTRS